jgi:hypothetical protein
MAEREGLLGAARLAPSGVIPASSLSRLRDRNRREFTGRLAQREGLTRAFGPRPSGDACASSKIAFGDFVEPPFSYLGFESPLRGCHDWVIETDENLRAVWRRGRDSNPRWAFDPLEDP